MLDILAKFYWLTLFRIAADLLSLGLHDTYNCQPEGDHWKHFPGPP